MHLCTVVKRTTAFADWTRIYKVSFVFKIYSRRVISFAEQRTIINGNFLEGITAYSKVRGYFLHLDEDEFVDVFYNYCSWNHEQIFDW